VQFRSHLIAAATVGALIYRRKPWRALAVAASGVLIDFDHLILYAMRSGDWSIWGALRYDKRRHSRIRPGDTRPRYGSLRSDLHRPWLTLPIIWLLALAWPILRPVAIGLTTHLALDIHLPHYDRRAWQRANRRCERCHLPGLDLEVFYLVPPHRGGKRFDSTNHVVWCAACAREAYRQAQPAHGTKSTL
jgi:hypothetical protein